MKPIKIVKNRSDIGAGTRGADMGIDALEIAAINCESDYFNRYPYIDVETNNETIYDKVNLLFAKRITQVREQCDRLASVVHQVLDDGFFPIVLSGDHSSAIGTVSGIKRHYPSKTLGVVWLDAHADLHSPYTSPSGNVHGMPLAAMLHKDNLVCKRNQVDEVTKDEWELLKKMEQQGATLKPEHLVLFGVRDTQKEERVLIDRCGIRNYMVAETRYRGLNVCIEETLNQLKECDIIYLSFDVDSLDCDLVSDGTGTPVSKGFEPREVQEIIQSMLLTQKVVCLEVSEVNPLLDTRGNKMGETVFRILRSATNVY